MPDLQPSACSGTGIIACLCEGTCTCSGAFVCPGCDNCLAGDDNEPTGVWQRHDTDPAPPPEEDEHG